MKNADNLQNGDHIWRKRFEEETGIPYDDIRCKDLYEISEFDFCRSRENYISPQNSNLLCSIIITIHNTK